MAKSEIFSDTIALAAAIARRTIEGNVVSVRVGRDPRPRTAIFAGTGKFDALWTRDACYACLGVLAMGRAEAVRGVLETLLDHQFPDGLVPRRIGSGPPEWAALLDGAGLTRARPTVLGMVDRTSPSYLLGQTGVVCPDATMLAIWLAQEYVERAEDDAFAEAYEGRLESARAWLGRQENAGGLIEQEPISDWKDTVDRGRVVVYNQALTFQALRSLARLARRRGQAEAAARHDADADALAARVRAAFWDEALGHFRDSEALANFSPDGNLLAIANGLATGAEAERIFARCDRCLERGPLLPAADPLYPDRRVPLGVRLVGMRLYHDGVSWPWQDALLAIAAARRGDATRARRALEAVAALAVRDEGFFEVYEGDPPRPMRRWIYRSEPGFSWSAGLFLRAVEECEALGCAAPAARQGGA